MKKAIDINFSANGVKTCTAKIILSKSGLTILSACFIILTVLRVLIQLIVIIRLWEALLSERIGERYHMSVVWD